MQWRLERLPAISEQHIYILSTIDLNLYLGTTTAPNTVIPEGGESDLAPKPALPVCPSSQMVYAYIC